MAALSAEECVGLLRERAQALGRLPKKSDFGEQTAADIKARLGPWPRALEAAGLKEPRPPEKDNRLKNAERRARAKQRRREEAAADKDAEEK